MDLSPRDKKLRSEYTGLRIIAVATEVDEITQGDSVCKEQRTVLTTEPQGISAFITLTRN